ncbi:exodeoxyribonuclease III [archaeon]|jgi:exodeoxyribonuclease III|nr:exodeoxyribonuclease III [archaeon]MBT4022936.1 exodeoxyribonuclease III [archaeon]MBT4461765.1 exodeoxyribonuclease III [archaeon]MBT5424536.1 exodeoxyribonuclease III [archaeon]MBT6772675.1 exodeoxyribonuclease III [archaeon]
MKLISWNVNGIRAVIKKGFLDFLKKEDPDILCIQETKAHREQVDLNLPQYNMFWNSAEKKGYSGTLILSKIKPLFVQKGIGLEEHDNEGRVLTAEYNSFYLVNVYTPNSKRGLERIEYRQKWDHDFLLFLKRLEEKKPVIVCGDLNVAHKEIDLKNPKSNMTTKTRPGNAGFSDQERQGFTNLVESGFIDTFRYLHPDEIKYSWWSYMFQARMKNVGWRIDYFVVSSSIIKNVKQADILTEVMGSDHCPVLLTYSTQQDDRLAY